MFAKIYHLYWDAGRANILCKYLIHKFFQFWAWLCGSFSLLFSEAPASRDQKILNFYFIVLLFAWSQKVRLRFLKSFFKLEILFLSFVVSFLVRYFQLKSFFSDQKKKNQRWNLRHTLVEKLSKFNVAKY